MLRGALILFGGLLVALSLAMVATGTAGVFRGYLVLYGILLALLIAFEVWQHWPLFEQKQEPREPATARPADPDSLARRLTEVAPDQEVAQGDRTDTGDAT